MNAPTAICIAYAFCALGFCLGFVACSVLCIRQSRSDATRRRWNPSEGTPE